MGGERPENGTHQPYLCSKTRAKAQDHKLLAHKPFFRYVFKAAPPRGQAPLPHALEPLPGRESAENTEGGALSEPLLHDARANEKRPGLSRVPGALRT